MAKVSFKIMKYSPSLKKRKPPFDNINKNDINDGERNSETQAQATNSVLDSSGSKRKRAEFACSKISADHVALSLLSTTSENSSLKTEYEASFALNLFLDGFSIGKPTEQGKQPPSAQELTESLHPYSRTCKTLFQAIDNGLLPGDLLEEIPCKYVNGSVVCEVRDYRKGSPISGDSVSSGEGFPVVQKVHLRPTTENIVKDIASMVEESWEYSDLMEIESRILKAVRPKLCLDPTPMLERLCENPNANKVNLGVLITRRQRIQTGGLPKVMSNNLSHGKKVYVEGITEKPKSLSGFAGAPPFEDSSIVCSQEISVPNSAGIGSSIPVNRPKFHCSIESGQDAYRLGMRGSSNSLPLQSGLNRPRLLHSQGNLSPIPSPVSSVNQHSQQDWTNTLTDARNMSGSMLGKRDNNLAMMGKLDLKKQKLEQASMDKIQQQNALPKNDTKLTRDQQRKDMPIPQNQNNEAMFFPDMSVQRHSQQVEMDVDQKFTIGETSVDKSKLSAHVNQKSTVAFKVKEEQQDFDRGQIGIERENQEVERNKDNQLLMELDNGQSGTQQMAYHHFSQQQCGKSSFQWQSVGQIGEKDQKRDDLLQNRKIMQSPREIVKQEVRSVMPSQPLSNSGDLSQPHTSSAVSSISLGPPYNNIAAPVGLMQQEKSQGVASVSASVTSVNPSHIDSQLQQAPQSISFGRRRSNSLPRTTSASGVASPGSVTNSMTPSNVNSPSTGTASVPSSAIRPDQSVLSQSQHKQLETLSSLISVAQRHGLHMTKKTVEEILPEPKKTQPSWDLLIFALASAANNEDQKDIKGPKSLAYSLVGGDVNARKTRSMNFVREEHVYQANSVPVLIKRNQVSLVMCERAKDGMVEAFMQFGDDQEDDSTNSCLYDILPLLCTTHFADRLAEQLRVLMEKDGYKLVEDKIHPMQNRQQILTPNVSSITHAMAAGASALGNNMNQLPNSPHLMVNQNIPGSTAVCGIPSLTSLPLSSANALASSRLPPSGNAPTRQIASGFMQSGLGTSSKPLQLDHASQLAAVQQQHQLQQHPQKQLQRSQQLVNPNHLAQLNAAGQTSNQQMNSQIMNNASQIQIQQLYHQQQRQQQHQQLQRKMIMPGSLGSSVVNGVNSMSGVGMPVSGGPQGGLNVVGLNNVVGMGGMNSPSMGAMPHLANINNSVSPVGGIGQNNILNMMGQHIGPNITPHAAAAISNKLRMSQVRGRSGMMGNPAIRNTIENNITGIAASNQAHNSANMAILGQQQGRGTMSGLLNRGMGPPKLGTTGISGVAGQNIYVNHQLNNQSSQINSQQPLNQQQQLNVQQQLNASQAPSSQQPLSSQPLLNMPNQLNQQQQINPQLNSQSQIISHQQINPQQLSSQSQLNPQQMNVGNLGSVVGGPSSPQRSLQTLGSVGSITSSPMELQSGNRGNSITPGQ